MKNHTDLINQFNSLLVDYLNTFNILETNIGLCISRLENNGIDAAYNKLKNLSCEKKIDYLYKIVRTEKKIKDIKELEDWCINAHKARNERNKYIHGCWSYLPHLEESVELVVSPWQKEKYGVKEIVPK